MVMAQPRFGRRCAYCDFAFGTSDHFEVHHLDGDHTNASPDNMVPICVLCHAPFHLDLVTRRWHGHSGKIIFLPEMTQIQLNNLLQAIFFAKSEQQGMGVVTNPSSAGSAEPDSPIIRANSLYVALERRAALVEQLPDGSVGRPGLSTPSTLARVLTEMTDEEYAKRDVLLHGLRYLPSEGHLVDLAKEWKTLGAAFTGLDVAAWPAIAGMA